MRAIFYAFRYLGRYPWLAIAMLGFAILSTVMVIVFPNVTQRVIDDAIRGHRPELIIPLTLIALAAFLVQALSESIRIIINNTFEQKVIFDLRSDLYDHIQRLPLSWFDQQATGDIMTRVLEDVTAVERILIDGTEQGGVAILQIIIVTILLFLQQPWIAVLSMAPVPLLILGALIYTLTAQSRYAVVRKASSAMNSLLHDNLSGIRQIKAYAREDQEHGRFNLGSKKLKEATLIVMKAWALYSPAMAFLNSCGLAIVTGLGAKAVLDGRMGLGGLVASLILVRFLYEPIGRLHSLNQMLQGARAAGKRVFEILDQRVEPSAGAECDPVGRVEFRNVNFGYDQDKRVLRDVSFFVEEGQTVALVGPTGAGKSTIVGLLLRFYELDDSGGDILIDGQSIRTLSKAAIRRATGYVTQESFLFNGSIRDNLLIGDPHATERDLRQALRAANALDFVSRLPQGLDTNVGERGIKLSVGEKQRISIARALLKDPPLLVLDEATASVDTETERAIQAALRRLLLGRTSFVIAHRLSTVRHADQILVLDKGAIVERGTHDELIEQPGVYARLCQSGLFLEVPATSRKEDHADDDLYRSPETIETP
jgi:ATP-binding cassette subfamily B protein